MCGEINEFKTAVLDVLKTSIKSYVIITTIVTTMATKYWHIKHLSLKPLYWIYSFVGTVMFLPLYEIQ